MQLDFKQLTSLPVFSGICEEGFLSFCRNLFADLSYCGLKNQFTPISNVLLTGRTKCDIMTPNLIY